MSQNKIANVYNEEYFSKLTFTAYVLASQFKTLSDKSEETLKDSFAFFDANQSGTITMKQLKQIVLTPDDVSELLAKQTKKPRKKALV